MIISISGPAGSGKSTLARALLRALTEKGARAAIHSYADLLRQYVRALLGDVDKDSKITVTRGESEHTFSGREVLQRMGTDIFRKHVDENYWVNRILDMDHHEAILILDDARFVNEVAVARVRIHIDHDVSLGGREASHESETNAPFLKRCADYVVTRTEPSGVCIVDVVSDEIVSIDKLAKIIADRIPRKAVMTIGPEGMRIDAERANPQWGAPDAKV